MINITCYKYIAIGVNVLVILFSLSILTSLYLLSLESDNLQSESIVLRHQGEYAEQESKLSYDWLPSSLQNFMNWLGESISTTSTEDADSSLFTLGRPLIVTAVLSYVLAIVGSIAIGLEHLTLLSIIVAVFSFAFICSLFTLVNLYLNSILEKDQFTIDYWNCFLIAIITISGVQVCVLLVWYITRVRILILSFLLFFF